MARALLIRYSAISAVSKQLCCKFNRPWGSELGSESDPEIRCGGRAYTGRSTTHRSALVGDDVGL